jgi:pimeloyl-ACP methyl ester carboxylesterase
MKPDVHYARNGNVALAYQVIGDAQADLMVVIGYLSNLEYAWRSPAWHRSSGALARSRRLILMDRRGSGLSDPFPVGDAPPLETLMDDIRVVLDAAGSARTAFFGIWDGCMLATLFAATYPERVTSLILFSSAPAGSIEEDFPWSWDDERLEEWLASVREGWGTRAWTVANARWQSPSLMDDPEELERWIAFSRLSASPSSAEAVLRIDKDTDLRQMLPAVRIPTLVLHRSGDQAQPIEGGRYIAEKIPGARFVELQGDDAIPWVGDTDSIGMPIELAIRPAGHGGPGSRDRALHRHRGLDRTIGGDRRRSLARGARAARPDRPRPAHRAPRPRGQDDG